MTLAGSYAPTHDNGVAEFPHTVYKFVKERLVPLTTVARQGIRNEIDAVFLPSGSIDIEAMLNTFDDLFKRANDAGLQLSDEARRERILDTIEPTGRRGNGRQFKRICPWIRS